MISLKKFHGQECRTAFRARVEAKRELLHSECCGRYLPQPLYWVSIFGYGEKASAHS